MPRALAGPATTARPIVMLLSNPAENSLLAGVTISRLRALTLWKATCQSPVAEEAELSHRSP